MSGVLLVVAVVVSIGNALGPAALLAWGLAGGDGQPRNPLDAVLAVAVMLAAFYAVLAAFGAFDGLAESRWWAMWGLPALGALVLLLPRPREDMSRRDRVTFAWLPLLFAVPPLCVRYAGAVG